MCVCVCVMGVSRGAVPAFIIAVQHKHDCSWPRTGSRGGREKEKEEGVISSPSCEPSERKKKMACCLSPPSPSTFTQELQEETKREQCVLKSINGRKFIPSVCVCVCVCVCVMVCVCGGVLL